MSDATTKMPLQVVSSEAGPYMRLLFSQLEDIRRVLDSHGTFYWVSEGAISVNGGPEYTYIYFGHAGDAAAIQAILDNVQ